MFERDKLSPIELRLKKLSALVRMYVDNKLSTLGAAATKGVSDAVDSSSSDTLATSKAVKTVNDKLNGVEELLSAI